ncbi:DUF6270 domain-containing protein [Spelaeicoccus albus]|uniref:Uncharacterized protein n=1 Tax=Spelaeicoccus albus TaxID=1280376 RepID=A0A7Z0CZM1_9MICO|nr:DUF6270 domain-containing protein [Spelaeicoccus albus]NYI66461.1 hypothetical protein [Spelaeicoccus albus]
MNISIVGSCVTRDSAEFRRSEFGEIDYFARTSWISQGSVAWPGPVDTFNVNPPLYGRFMRLDAYKTLSDAFRRSKPDILYLDLVDERLAVHRVGNGWFTESEQWDRCGFGRMIRDCSDEILQYGTARRHKLFAKLFAREFGDILKRLPTMPIVLHKAWLTDQSVNGDTAFTARVRDFVNSVNGGLRIDYAMIEKRFGDRITTIEADHANLLADPDQRWGLAPFHYVPEYYDDISSQMLQRAGAESRSLA